MKVNIGPYKKYWGPYQIAEKLLWWKDPDSEPVWHLGRRLEKTWVGKLCSLYRPQRRVQVQVDDYDVWDMDDTLSKIIYPLLVKLSSNKHGIPTIDPEDVPPHLQATEHLEHSNQLVFDWYEHKRDLALEQARWDWVLYELLWTFEQLNCDWDALFYDHSEVDSTQDFQEQLKALKCDWDGLQSHQDRINRGLHLFGKYYQTLWT